MLLTLVTRIHEQRQGRPASHSQDQQDQCPSKEPLVLAKPVETRKPMGCLSQSVTCNEASHEKASEQSLGKRNRKTGKQIELLNKFSKGDLLWSRDKIREIAREIGLSET